MPDTKMIEYTIRKGIDGKLYAVFKNAEDAEYCEHMFHGCPLHCFGAYDNAYEVNEAWFMRNDRVISEYVDAPR